MKTESKKLSKHALNLLERLKQGRFYRPHDPRLPAAMQELLDAGLVARTGRVAVIVAAYVPVEGYTPYTPEKFDVA